MVGSVGTSDLMVFTGNANPELARTIAQHLDMPLGIASVSEFSDGEISVEIGENVRGKDVFIIQPTCAPTNDNLMELMVMTDAIKRASSNRVTAVIPYFGYARQDQTRALGNACRSPPRLWRTCWVAWVSIEC